MAVRKLKNRIDKDEKKEFVTNFYVFFVVNLLYFPSFYTFFCCYSM